MDIIIESTLQTLQKSRYLLEKLDDSDLCNTSISPYYSSVGTHVRHILDFYDCVFNITQENIVDLTARSRNRDVESQCCNALSYLSMIEDKLQSSKFEMDKVVTVIDDLGLGKIEMQYTMASLFSQANSHTIHHYAIINYILEGLNITFEDSDFGYNPTTPKANVEN
ncbi:DinB family protein [Seonamhaeicola maritimus]|uniref:DinB family protein n=1 Tax=Seonamhaeicola maritimus TaxID=2591822 RepID=A0A5C7GEN2_9FLAO|nr:DinB family protein [Seonamhaeicola maritimus]TXG35076.1 DinB family protein [Seonamhaeicola maritimus]